MSSSTHKEFQGHLLRGGDHTETVVGMRGGAGSVLLRRYQFNGAPRPANFVCLEIPPGSEEGIHTHFADDRNGIGDYDEFYYIVSGTGLMRVGDTSTTVQQGDGIHVALDLPRGISNTHSNEILKVFLTFIER